MSVNSLDTVPFRRSPPGVSGYTPEVLGAIMLRWQQLLERREAPRGWVRHTLPDGSPRYLNRLLLEDDALCRRHAHDPVDWRPFGASAFREARRLARPVLLWVVGEEPDVGQALWERAFSDEHLARGANRAYVPVFLCASQSAEEVERYLRAAELLCGRPAHGAVLWLTPGLAPYAAWSAGALRGEEGLGLLLDMLEEHRELPRQVAIERCSSGSRAGCHGMSGVFVGVDRERLGALLERAAGGLNAHWCMYLGQRGERGGVSTALLRFALRHGQRVEHREAERWALDRLEELQRGAGRDHLGGGFFEGWQGPGRLPTSFDKDLGPNADLATCFLEAWELSGRKDLFWASDEILGLIWGDLRAEHGAFYASKRRFGDGYGSTRDLGWTHDELRSTLGEGLFQVLGESLGLWDLGEGRFLVTLPPFTDVTEQRGIRRAHVERARGLLAERRGRLDASRVDRRVLPGANGLAIAALSRAARNLDHIGPDARTWLETAERAAESTTQLLWHRGKLHEGLLHGARQSGQASFMAHVQLALGYLELFESTGRVSWLRMCLALEEALEGLWSGLPGPARSDALADRVRERGRMRDSAAMIGLQARLSTLLSDPQRRTRAMAQLRPWFERMEADPMAHAPLLAAAERVLAEPQVLLIRSHEDAARRAAFLGVLRSVGAAGREVVVTSEQSDPDELPQRLPIAAHHSRGSEHSAAFVCGTRSCSHSLETPYALQRFLMGSERPSGGPRAA